MTVCTNSRNWNSLPTLHQSNICTFRISHPGLVPAPSDCGRIWQVAGWRGLTGLLSILDSLAGATCIHEHGSTIRYLRLLFTAVVSCIMVTTLYKPTGSGRNGETTSPRYPMLVWLEHSMLMAMVCWYPSGDERFVKHAGQKHKVASSSWPSCCFPSCPDRPSSDVQHAETPSFV